MKMNAMLGIISLRRSSGLPKQTGSTDTRCLAYNPNAIEASLIDISIDGSSTHVYEFCRALNSHQLRIVLAERTPNSLAENKCVGHSVSSMAPAAD